MKQVNNPIGFEALKSALLIFLILMVSCYALFERSPLNNYPNVLSKYKRSPSSFAYMQSISIAISELKYGLSGHIGLREVYELLYPVFEHGDTGEENDKINKAITAALDIDNSSHFFSKGIHYRLSFGGGMIEFYKGAFFLFGFNIESVYWFYALIFMIPILVFVISFCNRPIFLLGLLLICCGFLVMTRTPMVVLEGLTNMRFIPLLTIIPTFYLALFIIENREITLHRIMGVLIQSAILIFIIYARNPARYQFIFLFILPVFLLAFNKYKGRPLLTNTALWTLIPILLLSFLLQLYCQMTLHPVYFTALSKYPTWHSMYMGLAAHPEAKTKYGIMQYADEQPLNLVQKKMVESGREYNMRRATTGVPDGSLPEGDFPALFSDAYENIIKKEYLRILRQDPLFIVQSILYKIPLWFKTFYSATPVDACGNLDAFNILTKWYLVVIVFLGVVIVGCVSQIEWWCLFAVLSPNFIFSLMPSLISMPLGHSIQDPGMLFTALNYLVFSIALYYLLSIIKSLFSRLLSI